MSPFQKTKQLIPTSTSQLDQLKSTLNEKCPELTENTYSSIRIIQDCVFL